MKVSWKIALYNVVFHQLPLIQHCSIFYKKNAFQSTKNFRRIQWQNMLRMASECISYNLEFQNVPPAYQRGGIHPSRTLPLLYKLRPLLQFFLRTLALSFLAHLAFRPCELLSSLFVRRPSVNISHFNLLLRNHWANCSQTLVDWSLDGPLSKLCPVIPTSNQDGRQAQNRKNGDEILIVHCCFSVSQNELKF